jgi:hypothetical protein
MALDEARRMFRLSHWESGDFVEDPFVSAASIPQDVKEVWFAGAHGDVGGGHPESESGLAKISLLWMLGEIGALGLDLDRGAVNRIARGIQPADEKRRYWPDDPHGPIHAQPSGRWWVLEYLPKALRYREWKDRRAMLGYYLPRGEPRRVAQEASLHRSVIERAARNYAPGNLATSLGGYRIEETQAP